MFPLTSRWKPLYTLCPTEPMGTKRYKERSADQPRRATTYGMSCYDLQQATDLAIRGAKLALPRAPLAPWLIIGVDGRLNRDIR